MAVTKLKAYHSDNATGNALNYIEDNKKTILRHRMANPLSDSTDALTGTETANALHYSMNPLKTTFRNGQEETELISGWRVLPSIAPEMFKDTADLYHRNGHNENAGKKYKVKVLLRAKLDQNSMPLLDEHGAMIHDEKAPVWRDTEGNTQIVDEIRTNQVRTSYMWVMSFPPREVCGYDIDPKLVHQIGMEYMSALEDATKLQFQAVVTTHVDKAHIHNHILQNAYSLDGHHKYVDTMETLKMARDISDRLSLKYNLPIILEPEQGKSMNWFEWKLAKEGKNLKDTLRKEIEYHVGLAADYPDFIHRMEAAGYSIRETANHFTYYTPDKVHRCRDTGLGKTYTKESIQSLFTQEPLYRQVQKDAAEIPLPVNSAPCDPASLAKTTEQKPIRIYVARYTKNGRRRSDLEILLLKAIKIIQVLNDRFHEADTTSNNPWDRPASDKIQSLTEALGIIQTLKLQTAAELDTQLNVTGAAYSHVKKEYKELSHNEPGLQKVKELLEEFIELKQWAETMGIADACLVPPKQCDIRKERAALFPTTPTQRRELFLALQKHPDYKTTVSYDNLTYEEARACIAFLTGRQKDLPLCLTTVTASGTAQEKQYPPKRSQTVSQKLLDNHWNNLLQPLSYEDRGYAEEYRQLADKLLLLGYDIHAPEAPLEKINNKLQEFQHAKQQLETAKQEYQTLKQLQLYCSLADSNKAFVYGNRYEKTLEKIEAIEEKTTIPVSKDPDIPEPVRQFSRTESIDIS